LLHVRANLTDDYHHEWPTPAAERAEPWLTVSFPHAKVSVGAIKRKLLKVLNDEAAADAGGNGGGRGGEPAATKDEADIEVSRCCARVKSVSHRNAALH
jgi:hypothetical protein